MAFIIKRRGIKMDWEKKFTIKNIGGSVIITGVVVLPDGQEREIDPTRYSEQVVKDLKVFHARGNIEVTNKLNAPKEEKEEQFGTRKIQTTNALNGEKNDHFVLDPHNSAISIQEINLSRGINVEEDLTADNAGAIVVHDNNKTAVADKDRMTKDEAVALLGQHWKKFESEVGKIDDLRKLNFLLVVAIEQGVIDKKKEILDNRIKAL
jgi:hypothetical protein